MTPITAFVLCAITSFVFLLTLKITDNLDEEGWAAVTIAGVATALVVFAVEN
jgi:hypothetical protein